MAKKIEVIGQALVITDTITSDVLFEAPKGEVYYNVASLLNDGIIKIDNIDRLDNLAVSAPKVLLSEAVDDGDVAFTEATFQTFARQNLGFKTASGGSGANVSDEAYSVTWNGVTIDAPSKNAVYDLVQSVVFQLDPNSPIKLVAWAGTQAQFDAQFPGGAPSNYFTIITDGAVTPLSSADITYDNTTSGLTATDVQAAIDEVAALTATAFSGTGTSIDLSNAVGSFYNIGAASAATAFTTTNEAVGGFAVVLTNNGTSEPTVTATGTATKVPGATWVASTDMYLNIYSYDGTNVFYYWTDATSGIATNLVDDTTPQLGGELDLNGFSVGGAAQTATGDGATTIDWGTGNFFHFQFGAFNETFTFTNPANPGTFVIKLVQDGVGSRTATWPASVKWPAGTAPTLTTTATTGTDIITFYFDGTDYFGVDALNFS